MAAASRPATAEDLKRIDLPFAPCAQTYEMLKAHEQVIELTKQTQRPQDIQDATILQRAIEAQR